ncbi:MAG: hypothetical protein AMXMBFR82_26240 [Candidatus Hydrogenedentota bacterium]
MPTKSLNDLIAEILDRGEPIDYESLLSWPKPPATSDSYESARSALEAFDSAQKEWESTDDANRTNATEKPAPTVDTDRFPRWFWSLKPDRISRGLPGVPFIDNELDLAHELSPGDWCLAETYVKHFAEPIERCVTVQSPVDWRHGIRPKCFSDDVSMFYQSYYVVKLLSLSAIFHSLNRTNTGWTTYLTSAAHIGSASASIHLLMGHAIHVGCARRLLDTVAYILNRVPVSPEALTRLLSVLEYFDDEDVLKNAFVGERVFALADFRTHVSEGQQADNWWLWLDERKQIELHYYLENMAELVAIARLPLQERFSIWLDYIQRSMRRPKSKELHKAINEAAKSALPLNLNTLTRLRLMKVALRAIKDGPRSLANEGFLPQDPFDPDGAPLRFRHCGDQFFAYSVGVNQADDGGSTEQLDEYGPLWGLVQHRFLTKDILIAGTPRNNGTVSIEWPWDVAIEQ